MGVTNAANASRFSVGGTNTRFPFKSPFESRLGSEVPLTNSQISPDSRISNNTRSRYTACAGDRARYRLQKFEYSTGTGNAACIDGQIHRGLPQGPTPDAATRMSFVDIRRFAILDSFT